MLNRGSSTLRSECSKRYLAVAPLRCDISTKIPLDCETANVSRLYPFVMSRDATRVRTRRSSSTIKRKGCSKTWASRIFSLIHSGAGPALFLAAECRQTPTTLWHHFVKTRRAHMPVPCRASRASVNPAFSLPHGQSNLSVHHAGSKLTVKVNTWWRYFRIETAKESTRA